jgi:hypothetical protein
MTRQPHEAAAGGLSNISDADHGIAYPAQELAAAKAAFRDALAEFDAALAALEALAAKRPPEPRPC